MPKILCLDCLEAFKTEFPGSWQDGTDDENTEWMARYGNEIETFHVCGYPTRCACLCSVFPMIAPEEDEEDS